MPWIALLAPVLIPLATAGGLDVCGVANWKVDRLILAVGSWAAHLVLIALWAPVRSTQDANLGQMGLAPLELRLDALGFLFALLVAFPAAVLLTMQPRDWQETTVAVLGGAAALPAVESARLVLTALPRRAPPTLL